MHAGYHSRKPDTSFILIGNHEPDASQSEMQHTTILFQRKYRNQKLLQIIQVLVFDVSTTFLFEFTIHV